MVVFIVVDFGENAEAVVVNAIVDRDVDLPETVEEVWTVGGIGMLVDKLGEGVEVDVLVGFGVVVMLVVVVDVVNDDTVFVGKVSVVYLAVIPDKVVSAILREKSKIVGEV